MQIDGFYNTIDVLSHGKRSIALNLKTSQGLDIFKRLSNQSDVIIDPYRAGLVFFNKFLLLCKYNKS